MNQEIVIAIKFNDDIIMLELLNDILNKINSEKLSQLRYNLDSEKRDKYVSSLDKQVFVLKNLGF